MDGSIRSSQRELLIVVNEGDSGWEKAGGKVGLNGRSPELERRKSTSRGKKENTKFANMIMQEI